jgi:hypothetical protein
MATAITPVPATVAAAAPISRYRTVAELLEQLGGPLESSDSARSSWLLAASPRQENF